MYFCALCIWKGVGNAVSRINIGLHHFSFMWQLRQLASLMIWFAALLSTLCVIPTALATSIASRMYCLQQCSEQLFKQLNAPWREMLPSLENILLLQCVCVCVLAVDFSCLVG